MGQILSFPPVTRFPDSLAYLGPTLTQIQLFNRNSASVQYNIQVKSYNITNITYINFSIIYQDRNDILKTVVGYPKTFVSQIILSHHNTKV